MRSIPVTFPPALSFGKLTSPILALLAAAFTLVLGGCAGTQEAAVPVRNTSHSFDTVVVDAGHGGRDNGTFSSRLILEKTAALDIALKVDQRLRAAGLKTVLTRRGDYFVELNDRAAISNRTPNAVFVSIHLNESRPHREMHGVETYYYSSPSVEMARRLLSHVGAVSGSSPHFMKTARFRVLKRNANPAVLVECGYLSNPAEARRFNSESYRQKIADAIAAAIIEQRRG